LYILDTKPSVTVIDPKDGRIVRTWGRQGTGPGEFDVTRPDDNPGTGDIAVAPNGQVYVADGSNHRVQVFRPDGTYISQFGSFGSGDGQFGSVDDIAIGRDGSIYLRDGTANRISAFTPDGKFRWRSPTPGSDADFASQMQGMQGIAVRRDGTLLVDCEQCRDFLVLDPRSGDLAGRVESLELHGSGGPLTIDPAGNIHVAVFNSESNLVFDAKGTLVGGRYLSGTMQRMEAGKKVVWGDVFWPAPAFLPDGRGFTFWKDGLVELKVTLRLK
jgi:tripartite motif-containing protein 71